MLTSVLGYGEIALAQKSHESLKPKSERFIADGQALHLPEDGLTITPPRDWEISKNLRGMTLIMEMPPSKAPIKDYSKPTYTRNITLAVQHEPRPIDDMSVEELRKKLEKDIGGAPGVRNFQILEHRFIDYRGQGDAILLYTAFDYNGFPMSQMHIFTAGAQKGVLLTYTDLAEDFQKNEAASTAAWRAMMSIELEGQPPQRYAALLPLGLGLLLFLLVTGLVVFFRRRRTRRFFEAAERRLYADEDEKPRRRKSRASSSAAVPLSSLTHESSVVWDI